MKIRSKSLMTCFFVVCLLLATNVLLSSCKGKATKEKMQSVDFIIDWEPGIDYIGYYAADELGFYRDEGLNIEFKHVNGAPLSAKLIGAGKALIGTTTADQLIIAKAGNEKLPIKAVATIFSSNPVVITSLSKKPINKIQDMNGKRLGMNAGSVTFKQFELIAKKKNLKQIKYIDIGWGGTEQLLQGQIDALLAYTMERPVSLELQLNKPGDPKVIRLPLKDVDTDLNIIGQVIAVYEPSLSDPKKAELIEKIVRASLKGWAEVKRNPQKALEIFIKKYPATERSYASKSLEWTLTLVPANVETYKVQEDDWIKAISAMKDMNMVIGVNKPEEFFTKVQ